MPQPYSFHIPFVLLFLAFVVAGVVYLLVDAIAIYLAFAALVAIPAGLGYYLTDVAGVVHDKIFA